MASYPRSRIRGVCSQLTQVGPFRCIYSLYQETRSLGNVGSQFAISWISCHRRLLRCGLPCSTLFFSPSTMVFGPSALVLPEASGFPNAVPSRGWSSDSLEEKSRRRFLRYWYHGDSSKQRRFHSSSSRQSFCSFRDTSCNLVMCKGSRSDGNKDRVS